MLLSDEDDEDDSISVYSNDSAPWHYRYPNKI